MSASNWKSWCHLCAQIDGGIELNLDTRKIVSDILQQYFLISIPNIDVDLSVVCQDCLDLVLNVGKFALNYSKVSEMFLELGNVFDNEVDVVRNKYGFSSSLEHTNSEKDDPLFSSYVNYLKIDPAEGYSGCETEELYIVNAKNETNCGYDDNIYFKEEYDENSNENEDENVLYDEAIDVGAEFNHQNLLEYENSLKKRLPKKKSIRNMETDKLTYSCTLCNKILQRSSYERHMISCHSPTILQNFGCSICSKSFISKQSLMKHESVHLPEHLKKIIPCPHCGKKFRVRKNLAKHVQAVHAEKRPYICEECGKSFTQKTYLKQHHFTHATERLCKCPKCFKSFKNTAHLKKHMDIHNEDVHQCPECGKQLKTKRNLRAHMIVHSDQKKYDCPVCDLKFKRSDTLKTHLVWHTGNRPFACSFCDKTFTHGFRQSYHEKIYHPNESKIIA